MVHQIAAGLGEVQGASSDNIDSRIPIFILAYSPKKARSPL